MVSEDGQIEKLNPYRSELAVFREILGVDFQLAWRLESFFQGQSEAKKLREVDGIDEPVMKKLQQRFDIKDEDL